MSSPVAAEEAEQQLGRVGDPCTVVIFGATGDLTRRKLLPALYNLAAHNLLSREFALVGVGRELINNEQFREKISHEIKEFATCELADDLWDWLIRRTYYIGAEFADPACYLQLRDVLQTVDKNHGTHGNYLYYLATAPMFFATIVKQLGKAGIASAPSSWRRVIIEKPFGRDLDSARGLNRELRRVLKEDQ